VIEVNIEIYCRLLIKRRDYKTCGQNTLDHRKEKIENEQAKEV